MRRGRRRLWLSILSFICVGSIFSIFPQLGRAQSDPRDIILHAAGAVEFQSPFHWRVFEQSAGREIRVVLTPPDGGKSPAHLEDSIWLVYHPAPMKRIAGRDQLLVFLEKRLKQTAPHSAATAPPVVGKHSSWPVIEQRVKVSGLSRSWAEPPHNLVMQLLLIRTDWGICEWRLTTSEENLAQRKEALAAILSTLKLRRPERKQLSIHPSVASATPVLGAWKAYRSRLRLFEDGRLWIVRDPPKPTSLNGQASASNTSGSSGGEPLQGRFRASDDLLFIEFTDGSKLNIRWRLAGGELLLTDHRGRVSRLKRYLPAR